jgi:hypothetical protein
VTRVLTLAVDRLEGRIAVLIADDGRELELPRRQLPKDARREGVVLRVELSERGEPIWSSARVDREEEQRRLDDARRRLDRLKATDPGGDVSL